MYGFNTNVKSIIDAQLHKKDAKFMYQPRGGADRPVGELLTNEAIISKPVVYGDWAYMHARFLSNFLNGAEGIPLNTLWVVSMDITSDPFSPSTKPALTGYIADVMKEYENRDDSPITDKSISRAANAGNDMILQTMVAQAVKVVGDSMAVNRFGMANTGYIQGTVGGGRTAFPALTMGILENNSSFVDMFLRPWMIALSHKSLKDNNLKRDITVYVLSRGGALTANVPRKIVTYRNCCPIDIDEAEFNYTEDSAPKVRSVKFAYSHYEVKEMHPDFVDLISSRIITATKAYPDQTDPSIFKKLLTAGYDKVKGKALDLAYGTAQRIVNNTIGTLEDKFTNVVIQGEQIIREPFNDLVESINDATQKAVGKDYKGSSITLNSYEEMSDATNDAIAKRNISYIVRTGDGAFTDTHKLTPANDIPDHKKMPANKPNNLKDIPIQPVASEFLPIDQDDATTINNELNSYRAKPNPPIDDARRGGIIEGGRAINQNDTPNSKQIMMNTLPNPTDDAANGKKIAGNSLPNPIKGEVPSKTIKFIYKAIEANDAPNFSQ